MATTTTSSSMTRLTGLATGLDVDSLVKTAMAGYQTKINQKIQQKDILEIKQTQYRQVLTDTRSFYNKYLDVAKSSSLLFSSNYKSVSFESDNVGAVTAKALSGAKVDNYKVDVTSIAKPSSLTIDSTKVVAGNKIKINETEFELEGTTQSEIADNLTNALSAKGINIKARYTQFSSDGTSAGLVLESNVLGGSAPKFTAQIMGTTVTTPLAVNSGTNSNDGTDGNSVTAGSKAITSSPIATSNIEAGNMITINGKQFKLTDADADGDGDKDEDDITKNLNTALDAAGMKVTATYDPTNGMTLEADEVGTANNFTASLRVYTETVESSITAADGKNADITITNSKGEKYVYTEDKNTVTVDNVVFTFTQKPTGTVTLSGKTDITDIKDKIVSFVNEYNTLMTSLNKDVMTKHNRNYSPLTSEQKEAMSEAEIKLWNEKVEQGQLYRDSDITRIAENMKQTMRSVMDSSGISLEKIGITPVKDYAGTANGTFSIDEEKLTSALQNNIDDVMDLFIGQPDATAVTDSKKNAQTGILYKLKSTLYSEVMKSDSALAKKVGLEGTASFTNNTITKSISEYEDKIEDMQTALSKKQQALYSKYATLETMMNNYNSQQSYLTSYLGS